MKIYSFIAAEKANFPTRFMCRHFEVSTSAFYGWCNKVAGGPTEAEIEEVKLVETMLEIHASSDSTYGEPRMTPALKAKGFCINHKRVERLMQKHRIIGHVPKRKVITTIPAVDADNVTDLVKRDFVKPQDRYCLVRRHFLHQNMGRLVVSGNRHRSRITTGHWLCNGRPHAHGTHRGRIENGSEDTWQERDEQCCLPLGQGQSIHER